MPVSLEGVRSLLGDELARVSDPARRVSLAALLLPPSKINLGWDYGMRGERLDCWHIGRSPDGGVLLVYCEQGFGPAFPWGFVFPLEDSMGMDSQWHSGLEDAAINAGLLPAPDGYEAPGPRCG
jgi:hypothetical protein